MKLLGRYKNGNFLTSIYEDGTLIRETDDDEFIPAFASNMDIKITNSCDRGCRFCHEGSTKDGAHANILNEKFIDTLHPFQEVALGGGDVTCHPDLIPFLQKLKDKQVIANITVNQIHFEQKQDLIRMLVDEQLIYGLGVSMVNPSDNFISLIQNYPNAVIHVINGIVTKSDFDALTGKDLKILILGYKHLRRGKEFFAQGSECIISNQKWLKENLYRFFEGFKVISFDNLAIEQLEVQKLLTKDQWDVFYMGDDSEFTYYIDMVERKFAKSSTTPLDQRYELLNSVDDMFKIVRKKV